MGSQSSSEKYWAQTRDRLLLLELSTITIDLSVYSFNKYFLITYYVPCPGNIAVNKNGSER